MVRAKFRCLHVTKSWDGKAVADYSPVMPKNKDVWQPENPDEVSAENRSFWDATPSGELRLWFREAAAAPEPGSYVYIDMEQGDGDWTLDKVTDHGNLNAEVHLSMKYQETGAMSGAQLTMSIMNGEASKAFIGHSKTKWAVTLHEAR